MIRVTVAIGTVAVIACLALALLWQRADARADKLAIDLRAEQARADAMEKRSNQLERAAMERLADEQAVDKLGKDLNDAIKNVPPSAAPSAASVALGCARLRAAGSTTGDAFKRVCG